MQLVRTIVSHSEMRAHEVAKNDAREARIWVSARVVSSNPGVSMRVTETPSSSNTFERATSFVTDVKLSLTSRLEPLIALINCSETHKILCRESQIPGKLTDDFPVPVHPITLKKER